MNRVLGDYFETLLYKIFVSIDEHTSITEVLSVMNVNTLKLLQFISYNLSLITVLQ